jgi:hypothetical protein
MPFLRGAVQMLLFTDFGAPQHPLSLYSSAPFGILSPIKIMCFGVPLTLFFAPPPLLQTAARRSVRMAAEFYGPGTLQKSLDVLFVVFILVQRFSFVCCALVSRLSVPHKHEKSQSIQSFVKCISANSTYCDPF